MDESSNSAQPFFRKASYEILTPAVLARRRRTRIIVAVCLACFALLCATQLVVGTDWSPAPVASGPSKSNHSASWDLGFDDGRVAGQADAARRHASVGQGANKKVAARRTAPRRGYGADRRDYQDGWNVGYSSAFN